jgi:hypothetical protein
MLSYIGLRGAERAVLVLSLNGTDTLQKGCTLKGYRGFESRPIRSSVNSLDANYLQLQTNVIS